MFDHAISLVSLEIIAISYLPLRASHTFCNNDTSGEAAELTRPFTCSSPEQIIIEEKCSSSASSASCPSHRVTFNDKNEVASQDLDGSFTVTYSQLGERITARKTGGLSQVQTQPGLRVQFGEKSNLDFPHLRLNEQTRNVTFDEESLQSYKR